MKRFVLIPVIGLAALAVATSARAQFGGRPDASHASYADEARQPFYESRRVAYENGYREGLKTGEKNARKRAAFEYRNEKAWQRADKGYHRTFGDRDRYRQSFRAGFETGYSEAYRRTAGNYGYGAYGSGRAVPRDTRTRYPAYPSGGRYNYPGQYGYGYGYSPAHESGLRDGYEKGREDARSRRAYDPLRHRWYRGGDRDYRREYGSKEQYQNVYRQAFRGGYDRGYREWAYRR
jgi:hypothetical protein